jgi:hypothetical protein
MHSSEPITYIVSITPGQVLAVKAYKQFTGERRLVVVPDSLYRVETKDYGAVTAVQIVFDKPLSTIADQTTTNGGGWSDDIYVTFQATAPTYGPNIVDILKHLMDTYTDLDWDATTFNAVKTKLDKFPANFPILDRKNTLQVLQEIAYQARCALWISNGVFYLKYLPEEPTTDATITASDLDAEKGIEVELTPTEDLVTKMVVKWRISWAPGSTDRPKDKSEKTMILRHNVTRYGIQEEEYDWYIYNQPDTIYKCATFWLIRKSHTWKRIRFQTYLQKLNLETFDCVNLDFTAVNRSYVATGAVKALVEKANYNSADNTVDVECLVPVKAGTMSLYPYFWPANLEASATWPPEEDELANDCGGGGVGMGATGDLPVGVTEGIGSGIVWVGGPNVVFRPQSDWGDRHPTDLNYVAQVVVSPGAYGELRSSAAPHLNLKPHLLRPSDVAKPLAIPGGISIDIRKTPIIDSQNDGYLSTLDKVLAFTEEKVLAIDGDQARIKIATKPEGAVFDFKLDEGTGKIGAGTAFLQD